MPNKSIILFYLLVCIAVSLFVILAPVGFIVAMCFRGRKEYFWNVALSIDQTGNVVCGKLFNLTLKKKGGYDFGDMDKTISYAIGRNKLLNNLTTTGKIIDLLLDSIDKNHSINAVKKGT